MEHQFPWRRTPPNELRGGERLRMEKKVHLILRVNYPITCVVKCTNKSTCLTATQNIFSEVLIDIFLYSTASCRAGSPCCQSPGERQ